MRANDSPDPNPTRTLRPKSHMTHVVEFPGGQALGEVEGVERTAQGQGAREPQGADEGERKGREEVCVCVCVCVGGGFGAEDCRS